jgi:hypothetical protein
VRRDVPGVGADLGVRLLLRRLGAQGSALLVSTTVPHIVIELKHT